MIIINTVSNSCLALLLLSATTTLWSTAEARPVPRTPKNCNATFFELPPEVTNIHNNSGLPPFVTPEINALVAALQGGWTPGFANTETPITSRVVRLIETMDWLCTASYSENWLDPLNMEDPPVRSPKSYVKDEFNIEFHATGTRLLCMVHAWAAVVKDWQPDAYEPLSGILTTFGYQDVDYGFNEDVDDAFNLNTGRFNPSKLSKVAANNCYSPKIMGGIVARYVTEYGRRDGYNAYGDLGRDNKPCEYNCRRYTDTTQYEPLKKKRGPGKILNKFRWKPMLEEDGRGYFSRQEHVTPHIGKRAKRAVLSDEDFESRMVMAPEDYDFDAAAREVAKRLQATANDDMLKAQIEYYDDKIAVIFAMIGAVASYGATFEQLCNFAIGIIYGEYDSILVAWNIKVKNDIVRPTTWIQEQMTNEYFDTYAGPFQGSKSIRGADFQAYVRVMPHSEYMSGSACICQSLKDFGDEWMDQTHGQLNSTGNAFFEYTPGASIPLPISTEMTGRPKPFLKHMSRTEPGKSPSQNLDLVALTLTEMRNQCGESRLNGGMHFERSVPDSYHVCEGIGNQAADYALQLLGGAGWDDSLAEPTDTPTSSPTEGPVEFDLSL